MAWLAKVSGIDGLKQGSTPIILCSIYHRSLSFHMEIFVELAKAYPEIVTELISSSEIAKFHFALDLLAVKKLVDMLNKFMEDIDPKGSLITDVPKRNRSSFISLVKSSSSIVKRVFDKYRQCENLQTTVKQLLNDLQKDWFAAELCASFLHETVRIRLPLFVKALWNENRGEKANGINCEHFWKRLETSMKLWTKQLLIHYFKSSLQSLNCVDPRCKALVSVNPVVLPCMHVMHKKCSVHIFDVLKAKACPATDCSKEIPENYAEVADNILRKKREQYLADRGLIMNFFTGMIYELFNGNTPPSEKVLEILLSYVTYKYDAGHLASQDVSPFPDEDAIDVNPVIRSFLLQLILNHNLSLVLGHIDVYLNNGRRLLNSDQLIMKDFIWMCISCAEDSLYGKFIQNFNINNPDVSAVNFVKQNVPIKVVCKDLAHITSEDVERLAKCRFVISIFVELIFKFENDLDKLRIVSLNDSIRQLLTGDDAHKESKMFLLKLICLRYGVEFAQRLKSHEILNWIVNGVALEDNDSPDPFVLYGDVYSSVKNALNDAAFVKNPTVLEQKLCGLENVDNNLIGTFICFALQQWIKYNGIDAADQNNWLNSIGNRIDFGSVRTVFEKLISPTYWTSLIDASQSHLLANFAYHLFTAFHYLPPSGIVTFFRTLLSQPENARGLLFPAMNDDYFDQQLFNVVTQALRAEQPTHSINACPNGHPYVIGDCGRAWVTTQCTVCKAQIGGTKHTLLASNKRLDGTENETKFGHCLGEVAQLGPDVLPLRDFDPINVTVTRFLIHTTMWLSSLDNANAVSNLVTPKVPVEQIQNFFLNHMKRDLEILGRLLFVSTESVITLMHKLLADWVSEERGCENNNVYNFTFKPNRDQWENDFRISVLAPVLPNSTALVAECNALLANVGTQNDFYAEIYNNNVPADNWLGLFWSYRMPTNFDYLLNSVKTQLTTVENKNDKRLLIMETFFRKITYLNACQYLNDVVKLHKEMYSQFGGLISLNEVSKMTIQQYLNTLSSQEREKLLPLIESFFTALKIIEPKLDKLQFSSRFLQKSTDSVETVIERSVYIEKRMVPNLIDPLSNSITSILPLAYGEGLYGQGLCSVAVTSLLIQEQNEFVEACAKIQEEYDNVKLSSKYLDLDSTNQLFNFDSCRDIYPLLLLHRNFAYNADAETKTDCYFDLSRLQCCLERYYNSNSTTLLQYYVPLLKTRESFLLDCLKRLRISGQVELSANKQQEILQVLANKPFETRVVLDASEILLRFSVSIGRRDDSIIELMKQICSKFLDNLNSLRRNPLHGLTLAHLPSLWQLIAFHSKYLRMSNREEVFPEINDQFKVPLSVDEEEKLATNLSQVNLLQFLLEFSEFLLLHLGFGASGVERLRTDQSGESNPELCDEEIETYFLYSREASQLNNVELDSCLQMKHAVEIWKFAAKRFAQTRLLA